MQDAPFKQSTTFNQAFSMNNTAHAQKRNHYPSSARTQFSVPDKVVVSSIAQAAAVVRKLWESRHAACLRRCTKAVQKQARQHSKLFIYTMQCAVHI
jgi:hypothetical protein